MSWMKVLVCMNTCIYSVYMSRKHIVRKFSTLFLIDVEIYVTKDVNTYVPPANRDVNDPFVWQGLSQI
jgi:hypothetical protein